MCSVFVFMEIFVAFLANHVVTRLLILLYILDSYFSLITTAAPAVEARLYIVQESIDWDSFGASLAMLKL